MRSCGLTLMTLVAMSVAIPARAQVSDASGPSEFQETVRPRVVTVSLPGAQAQPQVKPEVVVARLMSFDRDHDGLVTRAELPERMQTLLMRADASKDESLDANEVLRIAQRPPVVVAPQRGFEPGHYGFGDEGDSGFDTRLHIDSAIEDLRLASGTREKALGIGRAFADTVRTRANADLLAAAKTVVTPEQLARLKAALEQEAAFDVKGMDPSNVETLRVMLTSSMRRSTVTALIAQFSLAPFGKRELLAAFEELKSRDRLNDAERSALLDQLSGVLTDQECDDLRAALERRPILKQGALPELSSLFVRTMSESNTVGIAIE